MAKELFKIYNSPELDALLQILEHAMRGLGTDDTARAELVLATTAMRIGKLDLFTNGLEGQDTAARRENKASLSAYSSIIHSEEQVEHSDINNEASEVDIVNTFGKVVTNLPDDVSKIVESELGVGTLSIPLVGGGKADTVDDNRTMSDDDLLNLFG